MPANNAGPGKSRDGEYSLQIPLDASSIQDRGADRGVKVAVFNAQGQAQEQVVKFDKNGAARASFLFPQRPVRVRVVVGPENASADQLKNMQTLVSEVTSRQWGEKREFGLNPIIISNYYWRWWLGWCRNYKVTGRVVCADGNVVPGAQVCAYDVDYWWWWWSKSVVGCATTDANGAFEIDFTRCCGWWPWWWWEQRNWLLNPELVNRIIGVLRQDPRLTKIPGPSPQPDPQIFQALLNSPGGLRGQQQQPRQLSSLKSNLASSSASFDPSVLDGLRNDLLKVLPPAQEFERLRLWPWWPWWPWWDCDVDLVFQVTQNCGGSNKIILDESVWDAHLDIPTDFTVTLSANDQACCAAPPCGDNCPLGDCLLPTDICGDNIGSVGGNEGATASPVGLLNPGQGATLGDGADRPYAGSVPLYGQWGALANVDYYELLFYYAGNGTPTFPDPVVPPSPLPSPPIPSVSYSPMPTPAFGGFDRQHFVLLPSPGWPSVPFPTQPISDGTTTHNVIETIAHYEAVNGSQMWDSLTEYLLAVLNTANNLANGTYYLQVRGWQRPGTSGNLTNPQILPICGTEDGTPLPNYMVLTIDNQFNTNPGPKDINNLDCGSAFGSVHQCTGQPESAILQVQILHQDGTTTPIGPCGTVCIVPTDQVVIDFVAYDPDAYLAFYDIQVLYGASMYIDLLAQPSATLAPSPIPPVYAPATSQVGPDYGSALLPPQNASSPWWSGGAIRLTLSAAAAFPETCAYDLQLWVHKRTIEGGGSGSCDHSFWSQYNVSEQSFTIVNPCPGNAVG